MSRSSTLPGSELANNPLPLDVVVAVADDELRAACIGVVRKSPRLRLVASDADILSEVVQQAHAAVAVVGALDRTVHGVRAIAIARDFYPDALIVPVTHDDLLNRILELAALAASPNPSALDPAAIRSAMESGQPDLVFQPIVDLLDRRLIGLEALSRFRVEPHHPPDEWFGAAHHAGLGIELERFTLQRAVRAAERLPPDTHVAVNVSPATLLSPGFDEALADLPLSQVVLEITEHAPVDDYSALRHALIRARRKGLRIAIDDVGAGFASLRHVLRLDPDIIKLDHEITRGVEHDSGRAKLVGGLIAGASAVSTLVIAEGIETEAQLNRLLELGVRGGQGYFLGRPAPLDQALTSAGTAVKWLPAAKTSVPGSTEPRRALSGARILVVDDSFAHRLLIRTVFELEGAAVHEASTAAAALKALKESTPDLVLLDVRLPDGSGFDVLEHIRRTTSVPTLFVTAATAVSDRIAGFDRGADDYLLKPFSPEELVARVDAALRRRFHRDP